jgi:hypothetical protein
MVWVVWHCAVVQYGRSVHYAALLANVTTSAVVAYACSLDGRQWTVDARFTPGFRVGREFVSL